MRAVLFCFALMILGAAPALAEDSQSAFDVQSAYAFQTTKVQKNGAAFIVLENHGEEADRLIGASTEICESVETHSMSMDGGMMEMRKIEGFDIPAGGALEMSPAGHHLMLMGLSGPLAAGETFEITLDFEMADDQVVTLEVVPPGEKPAAEDADEGDE